MYVIVGFKVNSARSVYYGKAKDVKELQEKVALAFVSRGAEFVSIRCIKGGE